MMAIMVFLQFLVDHLAIDFATPHPTPCPDTDSYLALMERYNKLKVSLYYPPCPPPPTPRELVDIGLARISESELENLRSKGLVKGRKSEDGRFISVLPGTPPPTPIRNNYFPPPPVDLADDSFALPDVPTKPFILPKPVLNKFSRPLTKIIDPKRKKMQIIAKKSAPEDIDDINLSEQLSKLFPKIDQVLDEKKEDEKREMDMEHLTEILSKIGDKPFQFEFSTGGKNKRFDDTMRSYGLSTGNLEFLDFLQSDICKKILTSNKLKIHVRTGNIYYDNNDTSKSIFDFFLKRQDPTKGVIDHDFVYGDNYDDDFQWLIDGFDAQQKTKLDVFNSKNGKFFFIK